MGEASRRGSFEERRSAAEQKKVFGIRVAAPPARDDLPDPKPGPWLDEVAGAPYAGRPLMTDDAPRIEKALQQWRAWEELAVKAQRKMGAVDARPRTFEVAEVPWRLWRHQGADSGPVGVMVKVPEGKPGSPTPGAAMDLMKQALAKAAPPASKRRTVIVAGARAKRLRQAREDGREDRLTKSDRALLEASGRLTESPPPVPRRRKAPRKTRRERLAEQP